MPDPAPIEIYKALADDTRYRLYRYLRLSGRTSGGWRRRAWPRARSTGARRSGVHR